jgi:hypothetical protein
MLKWTRFFLSLTVVFSIWVAPTHMAAMGETLSDMPLDPSGIEFPINPCSNGGYKSNGGGNGGGGSGSDIGGPGSDYPPISEPPC